MIRLCCTGCTILGQLLPKSCQKPRRKHNLSASSFKQLLHDFWWQANHPERTAQIPPRTLHFSLRGLSRRKGHERAFAISKGFQDDTLRSRQKTPLRLPRWQNRQPGTGGARRIRSHHALVSSCRHPAPGACSCSLGRPQLDSFLEAKKGFKTALSQHTLTITVFDSHLLSVLLSITKL